MLTTGYCAKAAGKAEISGVPAQLDSGLKLKAAQWDPVRKSLYDQGSGIVINKFNHKAQGKVIVNTNTTAARGDDDALVQLIGREAEVVQG